MQLTPEKKMIIKKMRNDAQKKAANLISNTFDTNLRNVEYRRIYDELDRKINQIMNT